MKNFHVVTKIVPTASATSGFKVLTCFFQDLATAERLKRQVQTERDELQDEINSNNTKLYAFNNTQLILLRFYINNKLCKCASEVCNIFTAAAALKCYNAFFRQELPVLLHQH